jgi:hypothetical protein
MTEDTPIVALAFDGPLNDSGPYKVDLGTIYVGAKGTMAGQRWRVECPEWSSQGFVDSS